MTKRVSVVCVHVLILGGAIALAQDFNQPAPCSPSVDQWSIAVRVGSNQDVKTLWTMKVDCSSGSGSPCTFCEEQQMQVSDGKGGWTNGQSLTSQASTVQCANSGVPITWGWTDWGQFGFHATYRDVVTVYSPCDNPAPILLKSIEFST
jgi:hypothetical protein